MTFFQDNLGKLAPENGASDDGVTVASDRPYTNHLHLAPDK